MVSHAQANQQTLVKLLVVAVAMFGFGYALAPFYRAICDALGLNSVVKADAAANTQVDATRLLTVEFDANLRSNLPWTFTPLEKSVRVHPGALTQVEFEVRNRSDRPVTGQAIPSFGPQVAGRYFKKLDCFCFTQQTLAPGEVRRMPVAFVIEAGLPQDLGTVTLSYTFFEVEGKAARGQGS
ncbi:MAG TPA: cytochrome c oxidase assembly protein [Burkholderiales bacterium]|jgi:cytochrome c oxidase assembly protein subunit 11